MESSVRKISVGSDANNQLHISTGSRIGGNVVSHILKISRDHFQVWIKQPNDGVSLWKEFCNMPVMAEYDTRTD